MRITQRKGDLACARAVFTFTSMGYDVALPVTESASYDLLVDIGNEIKRVQAKFSSSGKGVGLRNVHCNTKGVFSKKTRENAYDWLYIFTGSGKEYLIKECLSGRNSVTPNKKNLIEGGLA